MNKKPDPDLYPPYSDEYYQDMQKWKARSGCTYPECCCANGCKYDCELRDAKIEYPDVIF